MKKYILPNGLTVIEKKKSSDSVSVQVTVKVGSNCEKKGIRGISHFIEHMIFEGSSKRRTPKEISNEIVSLPMHPFLTEHNQQMIIKVIKDTIS